MNRYLTILALVLFSSLGYCQPSSAETVVDGVAGSSVETVPLNKDEARIQDISNLVSKNREQKKNSENGAAGATDEPSSYLKVLQGLGIVVGLFLVLAHFYKRFYHKNEQRSGRKIKIIERTPLTPRAALILAEVNGRPVLVGVGADQVSISPLTPEFDGGEFDSDNETANSVERS